MVCFILEKGRFLIRCFHIRVKGNLQNISIVMRQKRHQIVADGMVVKI